MMTGILFSKSLKKNLLLDIEISCFFFFDLAYISLHLHDSICWGNNFGFSTLYLLDRFDSVTICVASRPTSDENDAKKDN